MSVLWVLVIIAGITSETGRAIDTSLAFQTEAECRAAQEAIRQMDFNEGLWAARLARATCVKRTIP